MASDSFSSFANKAGLKCNKTECGMHRTSSAIQAVSQVQLHQPWSGGARRQTFLPGTKVFIWCGFRLSKCLSCPHSWLWQWTAVTGIEFFSTGLCKPLAWHLQHLHKADTEQICLFSLCHGWEETNPQYGHVNRWDLLPKKGQRRNDDDPRAIKYSEEDVFLSHAYRQLPARSDF